MKKNKSFSIKEAFGAGFEVYNKHWLPLLLLEVVFVALLVSCAWWLSYVFMPQHGTIFIYSGLADLLTAIFTMFLVGGFLTIAFAITRGKKFSYDDLFRHPRYILSLLIISVLKNIVIMIGFILFIVPGIVFSVAFSLSPFFAVDRNLGPIESMRASYYSTQGVRFKLFYFLILAALLNLVGLLFLGVGLFITAPITLLAAIQVYEKIS